MSADTRLPFETITRRAIRALRSLGRSVTSKFQIAYENSDGEVQSLVGNEAGPYVVAVGRASADGTTGSVPVVNGEPQIVLTDLNGRLWTTGGGGGGSTAVAVADPCVGIPVAVNPGDPVELAADEHGRQVVIAEGYPAHDEPDCGDPVKIGARAAASTAGFAAVGVGDRSDIAVDVNGRLIVVDAGGAAAGAIAVADPCVGIPAATPVGDPVTFAADEHGRQVIIAEGYPLHDEPDCGGPIKIGGRAVNSASIGFPVGVAANDRVDAAMSPRGHYLSMTQGDIANDFVDQDSNPLKIGSVARETIGADVAAGDRVNGYGTLQGDIQVQDRFAIAGEDPGPDVNALAVLRQPIAVNQHSLDLAHTAVTVNGAIALIAKAAPGNFYQALFHNTSASLVYLLLLNNTSAAGNPIVASIPVPAGAYISWNETEFPIYCSTGITVGISTSATVYAAVSLTGLLSVRFK